MKRRPFLLILGGACAATVSLAAAAHAEPYRLRADAYGASLAPQSTGVGLVVLRGEDRATPWLDTEAMIWAGKSTYGYEASGAADALVVTARIHDVRNRTELTLGRQVITSGAIRPMHVDGGRARAVTPWGTIVEGFAGVPVTPAFGAKVGDWVAGGRVAQDLTHQSLLGVAYFQRRATGHLDQEQLGLDFATAALPKIDVAATGAWDLVQAGLAEVTGSASWRASSGLRLEVYGKHRSPSRLLPATSLFSALGDIPSEVVGTAIRWRVAPRLDLSPMLAARFLGDKDEKTVGADGTLRATLRLDDEGAGVLTVEVRRQGASFSTVADRWTGVRATARVPLFARFHAATELEVVMPDEDRGQGKIWPWGLLALGWRPTALWELAAAVEARSTPSNTSAVDALLRLSRAWGTP